MKTVRALLFALLGANCSCSPEAGANMGESAVPAPASRSIGICGQTWTTRNLDVATYRNGDRIPQVTDPTAWVKLRTGAWCWYDNDSATYAATYGKLYNWYAVGDPRGLAPAGWHVTSNEEWAALETCLGSDAGYRMKEAGTAHWSCPVSATDNSSGFTGLPGGMRSEQGAFDRIGLSGVFWFSTEGSTDDAWCGRLIHHVNNKGLDSMVTGVGYMNKADGYSVRCVRDR